MNYSIKKIFLVDSIGAFTTGILLSQVLTTFEAYFGMPSQILWILAIVAFGFSIYSILCHLFIKKRSGLFLKIIMLANVAYCITTMTLMINFFNDLKWLGIAYFIVEITIISVLVLIENRLLINMKE